MTQPVAEAVPRGWRLITTLGLAGLLSGLAIVGIYEVTLPRITANKAARLERAVFEVLPGSARMEPFVWRDGALEPGEEEDGTAGEPTVYAGYAEAGDLIGYAIPGNGSGFQDNIALIYGYVPGRKRIVGMQILESRETPGLGDKIFKDADFVGNFKDLAVDPEVVLVKGGVEAPNEVNAITGATISSKSVVKIINTTNAEWRSRLPASEGEPNGGGR